MPNLVELRGLTLARHHRTIVDQIDFELAATGLTLLGGENGAGKTTLLHALCSLFEPSRGTIRIDGNDLASRAGRRAVRGAIVLLPQSPSCPRTFTVDDLLAYGAWLQQVPADQRGERRRHCLDQVGLSGFEHRKVHRLSGGEQRRAFIASALMGDARLLLLDEPTVGLDAAQRVVMRRILRLAATNRAVLVSSHIAEDFEHLADRIILLDHGRLVFDGDSDSFAARATSAGQPMSRAEASFRAILDEANEP